ncbi:hypothetical protein E2C01_020665 [Portunus trituberculatus]|uniref:Uncharacterized protein n=1 Tax=Portunus trituberculatus TaxID=210409 RepID=A0A5B7E260_PORTR|nr:hypothetical protein [Portunus trituberculatus]
MEMTKSSGVVIWTEDNNEKRGNRVHLSHFGSRVADFGWTAERKRQWCVHFGDRSSIKLCRQKGPLLPPAARYKVSGVMPSAAGRERDRQPCPCPPGAMISNNLNTNQPTICEFRQQVRRKCSVRQGCEAGRGRRGKGCRWCWRGAGGDMALVVVNVVVKVVVVKVLKMRMGMGMGMEMVVVVVAGEGGGQARRAVD